MISFKTWQEIREASYAGNIGIMELIKFYTNATPSDAAKVKALIASNKSKEAWDIVQKVTGVKLHPSVMEDIQEENTQGDIGTRKLALHHLRFTPGQQDNIEDPLEDFKKQMESKY